MLSLLSFLTVVVLLLASSAYSMDSGEEIALRKLTVTTDVLTSYEDELVNEPVSGMLLMRDTISIDLSLNSSYNYEPTILIFLFHLIRLNPEYGTCRSNYLKRQIQIQPIMLLRC